MTVAEWENREKYFKERGPSKLPKWDPAAAKNKEKQESREPIDDDIEDESYLPPTDATVDGEAGESEQTKVLLFRYIF